MNHTRILMLGGDRRSQYLHGMLTAKYPGVVRTYGLGLGAQADWATQIEQSSMVILPVPAQRAGLVPMAQEVPGVKLDDALAAAGKDAIIIGGFAGAVSHPRAVDLLAIEDFVMGNALLTAQGAVGIALEQLPKALADCRCLVVGYGRIGRHSTRLLRAFGARVWATGRRDETLRQIALEGANALHINDIAQYLPGMDLVINTVPEPVLGADILALSARDAFFMELASQPYGIDIHAAEKLGLDAQIYPGIPGRQFPWSAARLIYKQIIAILEGQ